VCVVYVDSLVLESFRTVEPILQVKRVAHTVPDRPSTVDGSDIDARHSYPRTAILLVNQRIGAGEGNVQGLRDWRVTGDGVEG